jgi:hypothetical protein
MNYRTQFQQAIIGSTFVVLICLMGCARFPNFASKESNGRSIDLPQSRMSADSVALEVAVAQLDQSQAETFETFVGETDSMKFPLAVRKQLDRNGFRVSVMGSHSSATFTKLLTPRPVDVESLSEFDKELYDEGMVKPAPRLQFHRRVENKDGQGYPVTVSGVYPQAKWKLFAGENTTSHSARNARGVMKVTTYPLSNGTVRLLFSPEIHFGIARPKIGIAERNFAFEDGQSVMKLHELEFQVVVRPGETVLIAPTEELGDLGEMFFGHPVEPQLDGLTNSYADDSMNHSTSVSTDEFFPMLKDDEQSLKPTPESVAKSLDVLSDQIQEYQADNGGDESEAALAMAQLELDGIEDLDAFADQLAKEAGFTDKQNQEQAWNESFANGDNSVNAHEIQSPELPQPLHRFMLVRLVQTQMDDLFGSSDRVEKLSSTAVE